MKLMSDVSSKIVSPEVSPSTRGSLKIFLGYAPGVGKTFSLLQEAHRRKRRGQNVIVGIVDSKGRQEIEAELSEFEVAKRSDVNELSVPDVLALRPEVVVVDDLEHTNREGSQRPRRWQDVEALLNSGVSVLTTLGVQSLESLYDKVKDITGLAVEDTVPDHLIHGADEIELVDLTPKALLNRLERGVVFPSQKLDAQEAMFFREGNLSALREIAMREAAGRVDEEITAYRKDKHIEKPWATSDRIMICISPTRNSLRLIRKGWRVGQRLRGEVVAVHVEQTNLSDNEAKILKDDFALAQRLGIRTVTLRGQVEAELIKYAKENAVTQILLSHPDRSRVQEIMRPYLVTELAKALRTVDIMLVASEVQEANH
jgi:two-component system sensor histidine kinase KdpD